MFKKFFNRFLGGAICALGYLAGEHLWCKLKDPYTRANWKRKVKRIKNIILDKE